MIAKRNNYLRTRAASFHSLLRDRLVQAVAESRLCDDALLTLFPASTPANRIAA
jgi:hypothetical protein